MLVSEEIDTRLASSIVESALDQHTKHSTFACVNCVHVSQERKSVNGGKLTISHNSYPRLNDIIHTLRTSP